MTVILLRLLLALIKFNQEKKVRNLYENICLLHYFVKLNKQDRYRSGVAELVLGIAVLRSLIYVAFYSILFHFICIFYFYLILFHFILFSTRLPSKQSNHPFVVFLYNELRHTHKQEIEFWTCVCTSFHFCQLFTDN